MEFENFLQQLHRDMLEPLLAKWTADEKWPCNNCKAFTALKAPALAPSTASAARAAASPAPASADASLHYNRGPTSHCGSPSEKGRRGK